MTFNRLARRQFLTAAAASAAVASALPRAVVAAEKSSENGDSNDLYQISLAQWSLHRTFQDESSGLNNLDFPRLAKEEFGIDGIEYVNRFFASTEANYLAELKKRCEDQGVRSLLIMVDHEGKLGNPDSAQRRQAVENHFKWVDAAKTLGCHSIRVNAGSAGSYTEQIRLAADGLRQLSEHAAQSGINVLVENHGGLSSNGAWLAVVMERVGMDNCGTLPDFGNFYISRGKNPNLFDRYHGVQALMPYAKAVSAKTYDFNDDGEETTIDYMKMMKIVTDFGYHGYVGIEYEGGRLDEFEGIRKSKALLERVRQQLA